MTPRTNVRITGTGSELPPDVITTAEVEERAGLAERLRLEPGWLERVTGVCTRRWAAPDVAPSALAAAAGRKALAEPATANLVAEKVGARNAGVFDLLNACNSLVDAIDVGDSLIRTGKAERVLIATGERASLAINWQARTMEELLQAVAGLVVGDRGGAVVLESSDDAGRGICARAFRSDPTQWRHATGAMLRPTTQACEICGGLVDRTFRCNGPDLFAAAFGLLYPTMETVMAETGWRYDDLDAIFCYQPTKRFVERAIPFLGDAASAPNKLWGTAERFGNTSTTSLPLALSEAEAAGVLVPGAKLLVLAPSCGVSAAAMTMVW